MSSLGFHTQIIYETCMHDNDKPTFVCVCVCAVTKVTVTCAERNHCTQYILRKHSEVWLEVMYVLWLN